VLLGLTVACGIIALVPPLRIAGALALRSVSLLSSLVACTEEDQSFSACAMRSTRIGIVSLGIAALVLAAPLFLKISLVADAVLQGAEAVKAFQAGDSSKAILHLGIMLIDLLTVGAIVAGSWQLMVVAASVGIVLMIYMIFLSIYRADECVSYEKRTYFDAWCYFALAVLGVAGACSVARLPKMFPNKHAHFSYKNENDYEVEILLKERQGGSVHLRPGESFDRTFIRSNADNEFRVRHHIPNLNLREDVQVISVIKGDISWIREIRHGPLPSSLYTTIPVPMGPAMVTKGIVEKGLN
jgi:hypothetical protein